MIKNLSRREFLAASGVAAASLAMPNNVFASPQTSKLRVGVIGCGGRGTGAAVNCIKSSEGVEIVALADIFADRTKACAAYIKEQAPDGFAVKPEHMFTGFDAYKQVMQTDCDMVILATPPAFRTLLAMGSSSSASAYNPSSSRIHVSTEPALTMIPSRA